MTVEKAREIVRRAMEDRSVYDAMAARESEVWGTILPSLERSEARKQDAAASAKLRAGRHQSSLAAVARQFGLKFQRGLTLGCGAGRLERSLIAAGLCSRFHGIDISERAIEEARATADRECLDLTYEVADLNFVELPPQAFDLVVAQTSLHHVLHLEHIAEQIWRALLPGGYLWIHDFIGETQGQYDARRLALFNDLLAILPEKFRHNEITGRVVSEIRRPEPGRLGSPFECIRSGDIVPVFGRWFTVEWQCEFSAFMHIVAPPGTRLAYTQNEDTQALFELLLYLDDLCIREGVVTPTGGQYLMRPQADPER